jgi:hypothetical protein
VDTGDEICWLGGIFVGGRRGEIERRNMATYRLDEQSNRVGSNEELRGRNRRGSVSGGNLGQTRETT